MPMRSGSKLCFGFDELGLFWEKRVATPTGKMSLYRKLSSPSRLQKRFFEMRG
jgi:hypothetical protein